MAEALRLHPLVVAICKGASAEYKFVRRSRCAPPIAKAFVPRTCYNASSNDPTRRFHKTIITETYHDASFLHHLTMWFNAPRPSLVDAEAVSGNFCWPSCVPRDTAHDCEKGCFHIDVTCLAWCRCHSPCWRQCVYFFKMEHAGKGHMRLQHTHPQ